MDTTFQPSLATLSVVLLNLGCFLFFSTTTTTSSSSKSKKKKKLSSISPSTPSLSPPPKPSSKPTPHPTSLLSQINNLFSIHQSATPPSLPSPSPPSKRHSFASRVDVFPCSTCGEVFNRSHLLELHQASRHSLVDLGQGDSGRDIVRIIFQSGWDGGKEKKKKNEKKKVPELLRVLKVQNCARTLARFEEHRQAVRTRAAARAGSRGGRSVEEERCIADGNERLRFFCSTYICGLNNGSNPGTCGSPLCRTCETVRSGYAGKSAEVAGGVGTYATGSAAHAALPEELGEEFTTLHSRRAMLVCRVVAGLTSHGSVDKETAHGYDSALVSRGGAEELVVFDRRAVLPCFVVIYNVA